MSVAHLTYLIGFGLLWETFFFPSLQLHRFLHGICRQHSVHRFSSNIFQLCDNMYKRTAQKWKKFHKMLFVAALREVRICLTAQRTNGKEKWEGVVQTCAAPVLESSKSFVNNAQCPKESNWLLHKHHLYITVFCAL